MIKGRTAIRAKEARKENGLTQLQVSFDLFSSREAVTKQETGEYRVQPHTTKYYEDVHNNPWVGMEAAAEYVGWGTGKLDGPNVDLYRSSVYLKTIEELKEAIEHLEGICLANPPHSMEDFKKEKLKEAIIQCMDAVVALNHFIAVVCKEYGFSWAKMWLKHKTKLIAKGFMKGRM
jgi:transcriptional regulator with XRE-family HTH domain